MTKETYAVITAYSDFGDKAGCTFHSVHDTKDDALVGAEAALEYYGLGYTYNDRVETAKYVAEGMDELASRGYFVMQDSDEELDAALWIKKMGVSW